MRRSLMGVTAVAFILLISLQVVSAQTLFEHYNVGDDNTVSISGNTWRGQSFTVGTSSDNVAHMISKVSVKVHSDSDSGFLNAEIRDSVSGMPDSIVLSSGSISMSSISSTSSFIDIDMTSFELQPSTQYVLILHSDSSAIWRKDDGGGYLGGQEMFSTNNGGSWSLIAGDFMFEIYGDEFSSMSVCGNDIVEEGEECDPPDTDSALCNDNDISTNDVCNLQCLCENPPIPCDDNDVDGICNSEDVCPGTFGEIEVDDMGCSLSQFCDLFPICGPGCDFADWKNDEPNVQNPGDCETAIKHLGGEPFPVCVVAIGNFVCVE